MTDMPKTAPILCEVVDGDEQVTLRGGINCRDKHRRPFFNISVERTNRGGETVRSDVTQNDLDLFPEFDDLYKLVLCFKTGEPMHAVENGWTALGFGGRMAPNWPTVCDLYRIMPAEAELLFIDIMQAMRDADCRESDPFSDGEKHLSHWVEMQKPRWQADATAAIFDHDLICYGAE